MAIARSVRPRVLLHGVVDSVRELKKKPENGGELYGHEVVVRQDGGALPAFTVYTRSGATFAVGDFIAVECSLEESRNYGATLNYERPADSALDLIVSNMRAA